MNAEARAAAEESIRTAEEECAILWLRPASELPGFPWDFGNDADLAIRDSRNAVLNRRVVPPQCKLRWAA